MKKIIFLLSILILLVGCDKDEPLSKVEKPVITGQPTSKEVLVEEATTLTVTATGQQLKYQWYKNGAPVEGATTERLSTTIAQLSDAGQFYCVVSNEGGSASSEKVIIKVRSSFSWGNSTLPLGNVDWRVRTTTSASNEMEIEFYKPSTNEWYLISWSGGTSKGSKTNAKLIISSSGGSEQEITLASCEVVEVYNDLYYVKFQSGNVSGKLVRPVLR
ncbi:MAG: immunoglobulin domain-containing protein [Candidatus Peribacteria bacterium]|nr:immunoglobulin domain-containing protein [Candidatus Peribacteria bacterium]